MKNNIKCKHCGVILDRIFVESYFKETKMMRLETSGNDEETTTRIYEGSLYSCPNCWGTVPSEEILEFQKDRV